MVQSLGIFKKCSSALPLFLSNSCRLQKTCKKGCLLASRRPVTGGEVSRRVPKREKKSSRAFLGWRKQIVKRLHRTSVRVSKNHQFRKRGQLRSWCWKTVSRSMVKSSHRRMFHAVEIVKSASLAVPRRFFYNHPMYFVLVPTLDCPGATKRDAGASWSFQDLICYRPTPHQ
jgi:hypothetical protein